MDTRKQGMLAEAYATFIFTDKGYEVFVSALGNASCDFVVIKDGRASRVEVKSTCAKAPSGSYIAQLRSVRSNKTNNNVKKFDSSKSDYVVVVAFENGQPVFAETFESKALEGRSTITLSW